jgi:gliding motility-associated-like protein
MDMVKKGILIALLLMAGQWVINAQNCLTVLDNDGDPSSHPYWYSCSGGNFNFNLQSSEAWGAVSVNWGDGTVNTLDPNWEANEIITHTYSTAVDTFVVTIAQTSGSCVLTGVVVMEQATAASIQIPFGSTTQACVPASMNFTNSSTNVSETTVFTWDFGDGSADATFDFNNLGQTISHGYLPNTVTCETQVTLTAENYCNIIQGSASVATFNPIHLWDKDIPNISADHTVLCYPDTVFTFTNNGTKNCFTQGNIFQRQLKWTFGLPAEVGTNTETPWYPFPPNTPRTAAFPGIGEYTIALLDSNFCGISTDTMTVSIVAPPVAGFSISQDTVCVGQNVTFIQESTGGNQYSWNINGTWTNLGTGNVNFSFTTPGIKTVYCRVFNSVSATSCSDTISHTLVVLPAPSANITSNLSAACDSAIVQFSQTNVGNPTQFVWDFDNGTTFIGPNPPAVVYNTTGVFQVSLSVTANNGCSANAEKTINIVATPEASFNFTNACIGQAATFQSTSTGNPSSFQWTFNNASQSTGANANFTFNTAGDFPVQLIAFTGACRDTIEQTVTIHPLPTANFTTNTTSGCNPLQVVFENNSVGAVDFIWNFGDGDTDTLNNTQHTYFATGPNNQNYTAHLQAINENGCSASSSINLTVLTGALAAFTAPNYVPGCSPQTASFENQSANAVSYEWNFGNGNTSNETEPSSTFYHDGLNVGYFTVQLIAYSSGLCHDTTERTIVVFPSPSYDLDLSSLSNCSPLQVTMPYILGATAFSWNFGDGNTSNQPTPTHTFLYNGTNPTPYNVTFIGTSSFGCSDTVSSIIEVAQGPSSQFSMDIQAACEPATVTFVNQGADALNYQWNFGDGTIINSMEDTIVHVFSDPNDVVQLYNIQLTAQSLNDCQANFNQSFTLHPAVTSDFQIPLPLNSCAPISIGFQNNSIAGQQYQWTFGDGPGSNVNNPTHLYANPVYNDTTYTVRLIASSNFGCTDTSFRTIDVLRTPVAYYTITDTTGCYPVTLTFNNQSVGADSYSWNYGTGESSINGEVVHQHNFFNLSSIAVTNQVVLTAMTTAGCYDTYNEPVVIPAGLTASFTMDNDGCAPFNNQLLNQSVGAIQYLWDFGDGSTSNEINPNHVFDIDNNLDTTYTVTLTSFNAFGCSQVQTQLVHIYPVPQAAFDASPNPVIWPNPVSFVNNSSSGLTTNYIWDLGDGTLINADDAGSHAYNTWGNYNVLLYASNGQCSDTAFQTIVVEAPAPQAGFIGDSIGCAPLLVAFKDTSLFAQGWLWDFGDGSASINSSPIHIYEYPGTFDVRLIVIGYDGQFDTTIHYGAVVVHPRALASFTVTPPQVTIPQQPVYTVNLSEDANSYAWYFGTGDTIMDFAPSYTYTEVGLYDVTLVVNNAFNCPDTLTQYAAVNAIGGGKLEFPSAFTPNVNGPTDGRYETLSYDNDVFFPKYEGIGTYTLTVYNKWGEIIFQSSDVQKGWDGYYKGEICPQDMYIWRAEGVYHNGQAYQLVGQITLVRK